MVIHVRYVSAPDSCGMKGTTSVRAILNLGMGGAIQDELMVL